MENCVLCASNKENHLTIRVHYRNHNCNQRTLHLKRMLVELDLNENYNFSYLTLLINEYFHERKFIYRYEKPPLQNYSFLAAIKAI